jgi:galactokinase
MKQGFVPKIGQRAENTYFGKPSGLVDQTVCTYGGAVLINFKDELYPKVKPIYLDTESSGLCLCCVIYTRGSHTDLTSEYATIPQEMKTGSPVFRQISTQGIG